MRRVTFLAVAAFACAGPAAAQSGLGYLEQRYVQVNLGSGIDGQSTMKLHSHAANGRLEAELDEGFAASALAGLGYTSGFAFEVEGIYLSNDVDTGALADTLQSPLDVNTEIAGGFANVKYEYVNETPLFPYVGAGVGYGQTEYKLLGDRGASGGFLWQLKAGVSVPATADLTWDLGYRFLRSPDYETVGLIEIDGQAYSAHFKAATDVHVLSAGLRWGF